MGTKMKTDVLKTAIYSYNKGELSRESLEGIAKKAGRKVIIWDQFTERNIYYPEGDNRSRNGFIYDPRRHSKGKMLDKVIKKVIWKSVEFVHRKLIKHYDNAIFVYDDARLGALQDFLYAFIDQHGSHSQPRAELYRKMVDILLGMMKEDLRYRALSFQCYNELHVAFRKFEMTEAEKDNIKRWK